MKRSFVFLAAALAFSLGSCSEPENTGDDNGGPVAVTLNASLTPSLVWKSGSIFTLYSDAIADQGAGGRTFTCSNPSEGLFAGNVVSASQRTRVYAIHPVQSTAYKSEVAVSVTPSQVYGDGSQYVVATASASVEGNDFADVTLDFDQLSAVWTVDFRNITDEPKNVIGVRVSSEEDIFTVSGSIASIEAPDFTPLNTSDALRSEFEPLTTDGMTSFVFFPSELEGKEVTVSIVCDDETEYSVTETVSGNFGAKGTVRTSSLDMNIIPPHNAGTPEIPNTPYIKVMSLEELVDGDYLITGAAANGTSSLFDLMTNTAESFTYTEDYGDPNSTNKAGGRILGGYGSTMGEWAPEDAAVWTFTNEGNFDMKAGSTISVPGWSIESKGSGLYLNMNNGQVANFIEYVDNSVGGASVMKQRWTLDINEETGVCNIRAIQNSGRYMKYYPADGTFVLGGLNPEATTLSVFICKVNADYVE